MEYDEEKVDQLVLAVLYLTLHDGMRAWKGVDFDALDRLYGKGLIDNPKNQSKSIVFTEEGLTRAHALVETHFGMPAQRERE